MISKIAFIRSDDRGPRSLRGPGFVVLAALVMAAGARAGEVVRLDVSRDTWLSGVGDEADGGNGGSSRLKVKSYQELSIFDFDPGPLRGRVIESATLHVKRVGEERLHRVTVGTVGASWVEGMAAGYGKEEGASTYRRRVAPAEPWTPDGGDVTGVILGRGGTIWRMSDATAPDREGWQIVAVDPVVIGARVAGASEGCVLFDDTGSEWSRDGDRFEARPFPNRFLASRESGRGSSPYLLVELGAEDRKPPGAPSTLRAEAGDLPAGEAWLEWTTPADEGGAGTVGFRVEVSGKPVPRSAIPAPDAPGETVRMRLRDLGLAPGATEAWAVSAVDGAGNEGPWSRGRVKVSDRVARPLPGGVGAEVTAGPWKLGEADVEIVDELEAVDPREGPSKEAARLPWDDQTKGVRLRAGRNEFVAFQLAVKGGAALMNVGLNIDGMNATVSRYELVATERGPKADPIVGMGSSRSKAWEEAAWRSYHMEVYVGHEAKEGRHTGNLLITNARESLKVPVVLEVGAFTLPDQLSFLPEMNCYGLPSNEREYYRLAHEHRTVIDRVPYSQRGEVADGCAPGWDGKKLDWAEWDRRFGPLLDGTAFADLPRKGVPLEVFYLPIHENWPNPMEGNYNGDYWADRAFPASYRAAFVEVSRQMARHFMEKGWKETRFLGFLNDKNNFKERGWSRGASPWLLDEPAHFQDFWALRYFGAAFHEGVKASGTDARMMFRADISRPEWQRDSLDGLLDYAVISSAMRKYPRAVFDRKEEQGQVVLEYGTANDVGGRNDQPATWCVDAWALGCDGVVPWQTVGTEESWVKADQLSLFYPPRPGTGEPVSPSVRLKSFRRGQQDVEYLTMFALATGQPRWAVGESLRKELGLSGTRKGTGAAGEDAGMIGYDGVSLAASRSIRERLWAELSRSRPAPKRRLVELSTPPRDPSRLPSRMARAQRGG